MKTEFEYRMEINNKILMLLIQAEGSVWTELYGADADGNRGVFQTFCEVADYKALDLRGNDVGKKIDSKYPDISEDIQVVAEEKLRQDYEEGAL